MQGRSNNMLQVTALSELRVLIREKEAHLGRIKKKKAANLSGFPRGPLSLSNLKPVLPPSPRLLTVMRKQLAQQHHETEKFRHAYTSSVEAMIEEHRIRMARVEAVEALESPFRQSERDHRELSLFSEIHGKPLGSSRNVERHLRLLRRGGTGRVTGKEPAGVEVGAKKKRRMMNKLEQSRAPVISFIPGGSDVRMDGMCRRMHDPMKEYYDGKVTNPWTVSERFIFLKLFIWIGKDFGKIASHLNFKSVQDVVRFYYDHKLIFQLKDMRTQYISGMAFTDEDMQRLACIGIPSRNMCLNFDAEQEEGAISQPEVGRYKAEEEYLQRHRTGGLAKQINIERNERKHMGQANCGSNMRGVNSHFDDNMLGGQSPPFLSKYALSPENQTLSISKTVSFATEIGTISGYKPP